MSNKLKIKLTKEFIRYQYPRILDAIAGDQDLTIEISEDQIIEEKSNMEKWAEVIQKWNDDGFDNKHDIATKLNDLGINADAAYKEVCGNN